MVDISRADREYIIADLRARGFTNPDEGMIAEQAAIRGIVPPTPEPEGYEPPGAPMANREELMAEAIRRGLIPAAEAGNTPPAVGFSREEIKAELRRRGLPSPAPAAEDTRAQIYQSMAQEVGPMQAFLIGAGEGFYNIARGIGLADKATEDERAAMRALSQERPISTTAGRILGETAPFIPLGGVAATGLRTSAVGRTLIPAATRTAARLGVAGVTGAGEGAIVARGRGEDPFSGAGIGAGVSVGAELLFPIIGRAGRKIYQRAFGREPAGAMLDSMGRPTDELQQALDASGLTFEDLTSDARQAVAEMAPGTVPEQAVRTARFETEGIPATRGEITAGQQALTTEQRLLGSTTDPAAEPFRQFKLQQSEAIRENLEQAMGEEFTREEAGQLMQAALEGRQNLLRTQKNELYRLARSKADDLGGMPMFTSGMRDAVPDADEMADLAITSPQAMESLQTILAKYGIMDPPESASVTVTPLTLNNVERFRKTLNRIGRGDTTGAVNVAVGPIRDALDRELVEMAESTGEVAKRVSRKSGIIEFGAPKGSAEVEQIRGLTDTLREARSTVKQMKTEFDPASLVGQLTRPRKRGSQVPLVEASKVYDKITGKAAPVEQVRKVVQSLTDAGEAGEQGLQALQATTMMDLIESGFSTPSRKIDGVPMFNPVAFKRRLKNVGMDKVEAVFKNRPDLVKKIKNIDMIAADLIPPDRAVPKGTSDNLLDVLGALGVTTIVGRVPVVGGAVRAAGGIAGEAAERVGTRRSVREALDATPEVQELIDQSFPAISGVLRGAPTATAPTATLEYMREEGARR